MFRPSNSLDGNLASQILKHCRFIADSRRVAGICVCGESALGLPNLKRPVEVLLVIEGFKPKIMSYAKFFNSMPVHVFAVDKWIFERDIDKGFLGEAFAVQLIFPYSALVNINYLKTQEVRLKKRLILELLENLILDFPELSCELHIKPEFFLYEAMLNRARLFPPMLYNITSFLRKDLKEKNVKHAIEGYLMALEELEKEKIVEHVDGHFKLSSNFVSKVKSQKVRFTNILKSSRKTLFMSLLGFFPNIFRIFFQTREIHTSIIKTYLFKDVGLKVFHPIEDPKGYLFLPTAGGFVSLASRMDIEAFARKVLSTSDAHVKVKGIGGVLNDVYIIRAVVNGEEKKAIVKSFKDWSSFKWFPLTLWTVGTKTFAVLGRSRLDRECAINHFLHSKGFAVPRLLGVSHRERLVFMEYIEGETLEKLIKRVLQGENNFEKEFIVLRRVGELLGKIHALNVALGDTKPENILVNKSGKIYLLDFEQASRNGDKAWDIAEFLYYVGHYASPFTGTSQLELIAKTFLNGYLSSGGSLDAVKAAAKPKYTKVFSVFTFPKVILAISNICQKAETLRD